MRVCPTLLSWLQAAALLPPGFVSAALASGRVIEDLAGLRRSNGSDTATSDEAGGFNATSSPAPTAEPVLGPMTLGLLQWNPHWQCFAWNQHNCSTQAIRGLTSILSSGDIDFANLIEFEADLPFLPQPWKMVTHWCRRDVEMLVYNSSRWKVGSEPSREGCMVHKDRPFVVQQFEGVHDSRRIVVIGAHFPHPNLFGTMPAGSLELVRDSLREVVAATQVGQVVLIADTNEWSSVSSEYLMRQLGFPGSALSGSQLLPTCCFDVDFPSRDTFDRVMTNFGQVLRTTVLFGDPVPEWAKQVQNGRRGAFHKAMRVELSTLGEDWEDWEGLPQPGSGNESYNMSNTSTGVYVGTTGVVVRKFLQRGRGGSALSQVLETLGMVVLLACAAALAAGVWMKWKSSGSICDSATTPRNMHMSSSSSSSLTNMLASSTNTLGEYDHP